MKRGSRLLAYGILSMACVVSCSAGNDPEALARASLEALKARNLDALVAISRSAIRESLAQKMITPEGLFRVLLEGPKKKAVDSWDGELGEIRYRTLQSKDGEVVSVLVQFSERQDVFLGDPYESITAVSLIPENGVWVFHDVQEHSRKDFERWGREPPK